jgi:MFS family permease
MKKEFQVGGPRATFALIICSLLFMVNYIDRQVMAAVLEPMKLDMKLTDFQAGYINTMFYIGITIFSIPVAHWVDKWSRSKMIGIMALTWSLFTFFTGASRGITQLLASRFGVGAGEAGFAAGGTALIAASYPQEKRAAKLGIFNTFIALGVLIGMVGGGYACVYFNSWRAPFYIFAIPGIILAILAFFMQDYSNRKESSAHENHSFLKNMKLIFSKRSLKLMLLGYTLFGAVIISYLTWNNALIMRAYGVNAAKAGMIGGLIALMALAAPIIGGRLADKWQSKHVGGRIRMASAAMFFGTVTIWLAYTAVFDVESKGMMVFAFAMLVGWQFCAGVVNPSVMASVQDVVGPRLRGLSVGVFYFVSFLVGGISPAIVGALSDKLGGGSKGLAFSISTVAICGILASIVWWKASKYIDTDMKSVPEESI